MNSTSNTESDNCDSRSSRKLLLRENGWNVLEDTLCVPLYPHMCIHTYVMQCVTTEYV